jgi:hypothetical protein
MPLFLRLVPWFSRLVLLAVTVLLGLISSKFIIDPVGAAAASDMTLGSQLAITNMRASFGAFPLGCAAVAFACLVFPGQRRSGLYLVAAVIGVVLAARVYGVLLDGTLAENIRVLMAEAVVLVLSTFAILGEARRERWRLQS